MLATLSGGPPPGEGWVFERKLDGERCVATVAGGRAELRSRTGRDLTATYPEVVAALVGRATAGAVVDGELVAFDRDGRSSFGLLQQRLGVAHPSPELLRSVPVTYSVFDVLAAGAEDVTGRPLQERAAVLDRVLPPGDPLPRPERRDSDGAAFLAHACAQGWEGLIAKRADAPYAPGRSRDWLKLKCVQEQEFVVGGWTDPAGSRAHLGALLVGYHEDGVLRYAGKVGTGFDRRSLADLAARLAPLARPSSPFADARPVPPRTHWVDPVLVAQIAFAEWTTAGRLRQPRYLGLRDDKPAGDVVRERPTA
jgi:bifunctional non-homologous end joining protein LigD